MSRMPKSTKIILNPGRDRSVIRRHPWIFAGAIGKIEGPRKPGQVVEIIDDKGRWLARGIYSPRSQIAVRLLTWEAGELIENSFFEERLRRAILGRDMVRPPIDSNARRLVHAEADGLPGTIVDQYGEYLVCQFLTAGAESFQDSIVSSLAKQLKPAGIYERSDVTIREKEGLHPVSGNLFGQEPPALIEIQEGPCRFAVDVRNGHKTGFYLDQRDNRSRLRDYAKNTDILDCFSYTGGFSISALAAGARRVTCVDVSSDALNLIKHNAGLNRINEDCLEFIQGDVFNTLRTFRDSGRQFDLIVLDPPKFAETKTQLDRAARGYKDINLFAMKDIRPGGLLFTFSCSGAMEPTLFQKVVADAALDAGRKVQILHRLSQPPDHPVDTGFPEGYYLKGLVCRIW
jgi:23S rRNA (cytosine1962-C5)-methyltransferase